MTKPSLPPAPRPQRSGKLNSQKSVSGTNPLRKRNKRRSEKGSDVLVSAVLSTYLLTHLHHVLQRAEFQALNEGRSSQANNLAQLRKLLCMDARSMKDASAQGIRESEADTFNDQKIESKVA